ncbi:hypothetical protein PV04_09829 [Phialophora macrospora]|uniref:Uncharacterized protein n=1 Tax=Phialophora macrospora TaxID=1851006 RepID=A0A0D2DKL6_9EURO|nr:hypothetical protein PV04_09829 [Phialophora macrospora]
MHLPDGYTYETHSPWSRADPSAWSQDTSSSEWEHLSNTYLFPMASPTSLPRSWSSRGPLPTSTPRECVTAFREAGTDSFHHSMAEAEVDGGNRGGRPSGSLNNTPIPTRTATKPQKRGRQRTPVLPVKWRSTDVTDAEPDMSWEARQRYERRFALTEVRRESGCQPTADEEDCSCTECKSRRWRRER